MTKSKVIRIIPMLLLIIIIGSFLIQLKLNKNSVLNSNIQTICITSICLISSDKTTECIYTKSKISYLNIKTNSVVITQTATNCKE